MLFASTDDEFRVLSKEKETNFSPYFLDLEGVEKYQVFFLGSLPRLHNAKSNYHVVEFCGEGRDGSRGRVDCFLCLHLPGVD